MKNKMRSKVHIARPLTLGFNSYCLLIRFLFLFHFLFIYFYFCDWNEQFSTHKCMHFFFHINSNPSINIYFNILLNGQLTWNDLLFQAHYTSLRLYDFSSISLVHSLSLFHSLSLHFISFHSIQFNSIPLHCIYATSFIRLHGISNICYMLWSWVSTTATTAAAKKDILRWSWRNGNFLCAIAWASVGSHANVYTIHAA